MNSKSIAALVISLSVAILACDKTKESSPIGPSTPESQLDDLIYPISGASPELNNDDLLPLSYLGNSRIVGLGEATHGTKEFFQLKHRIFKYLVQNHNFKVFGFESDFGESIYFDRYVTKGEGNLTDLMKTKMHFWTWRTYEVMELLYWMKTYNDGKSEEDKIHYIGFDCQFMTYQPDLLLDYFSKVKPEFIDEIDPTLNMIKAMNNTSFPALYAYYRNIDRIRKREISDSLTSVLTRLTDIESELISKSSDWEYQYIRQLVRNMQQTNDVIFASTHNDYRVNYRDKYMAENSIWLSNLFGGNTKIAIWAHNGHVSNDANYMRGGGSMGSFLKGEIDDQYQIVGFSFSKGSFYSFTHLAPGEFGGLDVQTINTDPLEDSLNDIFFNAKLDNFILRLADIPTESELGSWFSTPRLFMLIGSAFDGNPVHYYRNVSRDYYDVIINYDMTSAAAPLNAGFSRMMPYSPSK